MDGLILEQSEYLVVLNALKATNIIGINSKRLFPTDKKSHQALIAIGLEKLKQRGFIKVINNQHQLNPKLLQLISVVAYPELVIITLRDLPEIGQQIYLHYQQQQRLVEQTFPTTKQYRLGILPNIETTLDRIMKILPITNHNQTTKLNITIPQQSLFQAKSLAEDEKNNRAIQLLNTLGLNKENSIQLLNALKNPKFVGAITFIYLQQKQNTNTKTVTIVQGKNIAWQMIPTTQIKPKQNGTNGSFSYLSKPNAKKTNQLNTDDKTLLNIETTQAHSIRMMLNQWSQLHNKGS